MKSVLLLHNHYQQLGGEDGVFEAEKKMLESNGYRVFSYERANTEINKMTKVSTFLATLWNLETYRALKKMITLENIRLVHFHNTFPLVSPAAYYAARDVGVSVVQTLHNYRLICPGAILYRNGAVCETCIRKLFPWPAVAFNCYRKSRFASAAVFSMLALHRVIKTYTRHVDAYIALTKFAKNKFTEGGLAPEKIFVKPNFLDKDPGKGDGEGGYGIFVGRLSPEKGLQTIIAAWKYLGKKIPIKIVGTGPIEEELLKASSGIEGVEWLGFKTHEQVLELMKRASFLVFPSVWYEGFPLTLIEAFAVGLPPIATDLGSMSEIVDNGRTGLLFRSNDPEDLVSKVNWLLEHAKAHADMRFESRAEYERKYTAERNIQILSDIYNSIVK